MSPVYHVVFDDKLESVCYGENDLEALKVTCRKLFEIDKDDYISKNFGLGEIEAENLPFPIYLLLMRAGLPRKNGARSALQKRI